MTISLKIYSRFPLDHHKYTHHSLRTINLNLRELPTHVSIFIRNTELRGDVETFLFYPNKPTNELIKTWNLILNFDYQFHEPQKKKENSFCAVCPPCRASCLIFVSPGSAEPLTVATTTNRLFKQYFWILTLFHKFTQKKKTKKKTQQPEDCRLSLMFFFIWIQTFLLSDRHGSRVGFSTASLAAGNSR